MTIKSLKNRSSAQSFVFKLLISQRTRYFKEGSHLKLAAAVDLAQEFPILLLGQLGTVRSADGFKFEKSMEVDRETPA